MQAIVYDDGVTDGGASAHTHLHQRLCAPVAVAAVAVGMAARVQRVVVPLARAEELPRHELDRIGEQRSGCGDDGGPREVGPPQAGVLSAVSFERFSVTNRAAT